MNIISIRGATTVENNLESEILHNTEILLNEIIEKNNINIDDIISIFFTMTRDLTKVYPAVSARKLGIVNASLMCLDELYIENSLEKCIRIMFLVNSNKKQKDAKHVYLNNAKNLRKDLLKKDNEV